MADGNTTHARSASRSLPLGPEGVTGLGPGEYREGFGEDLAETLDISHWSAGRDLAEEYQRLQDEIERAVEREGVLERRVRQEIYPRLAWAPGSPPGAGVHAVPVEEIKEIHRGLLFQGGVEGCDGTCDDHDTLALTIHQIGVSLVSYRGDRGTWFQRLYRHDLRLNNGDPVADALDLLERRNRRGGLHPTPRDQLSELARRAIMSYAERALLLEQATAVWRLGHGSPAPMELIASGFTDLVVESIRVIREMIEGHQKFVYVASEPDARGLLTIGQALRPLEFAVVDTLRERIAPTLDDWHPGQPATVGTFWDGQCLSAEQWVQRFRDEVAPKVVYGVYRATLLAPPQLFYAHVDHADLAARIALADSVLQEQRGFPLLIDLAHQVCRSVYGGGSLGQAASAAYAACGAPFRYRSERASRD